MQDQGKRLIIAVVIALGVLLLWQKVFPPPPVKPGAGSGSAAVAAGSGSGFVAPTTIKATSPVGYSIVARETAGQTIDLTFPHFVATFSSTDGALAGWRLTDPRYAGDATRGELVPAQGAAFQVGFTKDSTFKLPDHAQWTGTKTSDRQVVYKLVSDGVEVTKTFDIVPEAYLVRLTITVTPKLAPGHEAHEALAITAYQLQDPKADTSSSRIQPRVWASASRTGGQNRSTDIKDVIAKPRLTHDIQWGGFEHPYLLVGFAPKPGSSVDKHAYASAAGLARMDLVYPAVIFKSGDQGFTRELVGYLGPKNTTQLRDADEAAGFTTGFSTTIDLGWFGFLAKILLWLLLRLYAVFGNWGVAIIMLTVVTKVATLYWTTKSMRSMKEMQLLAPQLKAIQAKYKDDKQRQQTEIWALYKENGVSPVAGCLPMLLQMPIWIALYRMLEYAAELYRQPFVFGWLPDLTATDPTHVLPIVLTIGMFVQTRLTPQNPDPQQKTQQQIMQYGMPLMFGAMSWVFPSGLSLYMLTNTILQALNSVYVNNFDKKNMALTAKIRENQRAAAAAKQAAKNGTAAPEAEKAPAKGATKTPAKAEKTADKPDDDAAVASASKSAAPRGPSQKKKKGRR